MTCSILGCADPNCRRLLAFKVWRDDDQACHRRTLLDALGRGDADG